MYSRHAWREGHPNARGTRVVLRPADEIQDLYTRVTNAITDAGCMI
jgi:hypothetical protein